MISELIYKIKSWYLLRKKVKENRKNAPHIYK